jgi:hypothetical protein
MRAPSSAAIGKNKIDNQFLFGGNEIGYLPLAII